MALCVNFEYLSGREVFRASREQRVQATRRQDRQLFGIQVELDQRIVVHIRVPVPEGFRIVRAYPIEDLPIKFLPPIEVHIRRMPVRSPIPYQATISCLWLTFKQMRLVAAVLDDIWDSEASIEDNVEAWLSRAPHQILKELNITESLEMEWRDFVAKHGRVDILPIDAAKDIKRRNKNLVFRSIALYPKSVEINHIISEFSSSVEQEGFIPGNGVTPCTTLCENFLPTRSLRTTLCSDHGTCFTCLKQYILKCTTDFLACPRPECAGKFRMPNLKAAFHHDDEVSKVLAAREMLPFAMTPDEDKELFSCPHCQASHLPKGLVRKASITLCSSCDLCWCDDCMNEDQYICLVMTGKRFLNVQKGSEVWAQLLEELGDERSHLAVVAWNTQNSKVYDQKWCPGCLVPSLKVDGCHHMVCSQCNQHYCYRCLAPLELHTYKQHFINSGCALFDF